MTSLAVFLSVVAIFVSVATLVLSIGNARRINRIVTRRSPPVEPGALADGEMLPDSVVSALSKLVGETTSTEFVMVVATGACPACRSLAKVLNRKHYTFGDLPLLVVDSSDPDTPSFRELLDFPATILRDDKKIVYSALEVTAVPYSFYVRQGRIVKHRLGDSIDDLLEESTVADTTGHSA